MDQVLTEPVSDTVKPTDLLQPLIDQLKQTPSRLKVEGLHGASRALFLVQLRKAISSPMIVLTRDQSTGESLLGDLQYFCNFEKCRQYPKFFPSWELLPYEHLSPLSEVAGERLDILTRLNEGGCPFLVVPVESALQKLIPRSILNKMTYTVKKGMTWDREFMEMCLVENGYTRNTMVESRGEFSLRGDILDIFLPAYTDPVRVEFFGDEVESIRYFDLGSQVSLRPTSEIRIFPVRELCLSDEERKKGLQTLAEEEVSGTAGRLRLQEIVDKFEHLGAFPGMEIWAPYFYSKMETLFDYLPPDTLFVFDEEELLEQNVQEISARVEEEYCRALEQNDVPPPPGELYLTPQEFDEKTQDRSALQLNAIKLSPPDSKSIFHWDVKPLPAFHGQFDKFAESTLEWQENDQKVTVVAPVKGQVKRVHELLNHYGMHVDVDVGRISSGFQFPASNLVFVAEQEIFGRTHKHRYRRKPKSQSFQRGFKDLKPGDFLVHIDYGIGKFTGTRELNTALEGGEFLEIFYADNEKLYIPMDGLAHIQKYVGSEETPPPLSKLGGVSWKRQKNKIKESIREMAGELLKLYASRKVAESHRYENDPIAVQEFGDRFEYEETDDQLKAIDEIYEDLDKPTPMDRLICGDVGYGKTEVAMRAAFRVVQGKKQVAVLVPTTILAQQHLLTFQERFRSYPVKIDMVNRFRTGREQKEIFAKLKSGDLDIIIGTHRLLSKDVEFSDLGLIIIDEEQRFGVRHKEKFKKLRTSVDILTLSATPIPRTLHFSLMGVRDLSVIETPPVDRLAVKTFIRKFDEDVIRDAILRERNRNGQVYFVHNKVKSIHSLAEMIHRIVPDASLGIAHGQLPEHQLEKVMKRFIEKEIDVLVCTSIVESGLDIPAANTIIINRADQFGLAQLYQLRGRVGRYRHQAYAYLMIPGAMAISEDARKRLYAIEELSDLGAGFQLAARDMEIRGTGNLLGKHQSGHINAVGFDLYTKLIEDTVKEIRGEKVESRIEPEIELEIKGYIPKEYIQDLNQRLEMYRRLQLVSDLGSLSELCEEINDRYGAFPEALEKWVGLIEVRIYCQQLHISRAHIKRDRAHFRIESSTQMTSDQLIPVLDDKLSLISEYEMSLLLDRKSWQKDLQRITHYLAALLNVQGSRSDEK